MCHQHECQTKGQGRVERRREVGEKGRRSNRRTNKKAAMMKGPDMCATDQMVNGVSLVDPTSSQDDLPAAQIYIPPPPSLTTPTLPPTSNETCRTRKDEGKNQGRGDLRGREVKEAAGRIDEQMTAVQGPGRGTTDQMASSMTDDKNIAAPASSLDDNGGDVNIHHIKTGLTPNMSAIPTDPQSPLMKRKGHEGKKVNLRVELRTELVKSTVKEVEGVETVKLRESSRVDEPEVKRKTRLKEVKVELGGKAKDDGRMNDTGDQMSSTSCDSQ
ncbi:hypothetical protein BDN67DRAFT_986126 [Paxillus ammoniavirescens]|nr:hypothetical protein BDN67DRAFT_986126 [Paxillus ammoniavirescens]